MSDSAFPTAPYPGYTLAQLEAMLDGCPGAAYATIETEVRRRHKVMDGDRSVMTAGERLRSVRRGRGVSSC